MKRKLSIAILGTRGIPARYGGFETFAEELSVRLARTGHEVTVYGRHALFSRPAGPNKYQGVRLRSAPTVMHKYLETPLHAFFSFLDLFRTSYDVVLLCNAANSPFAWLVRLRRIPLLINVDGIERRRSKWNSFGKMWYALGERASVWFADKIIADAEVIADYYRSTYKIEPAVIAYGSDPKPLPPGDTLAKFGVKPKEYLLYVSRLEPENNVRGVVEAYNGLKTEMPLVVVGDAPYAKEYIRQVKELACERVIFTGFQFGEAYRELRSNCYLYIQATEVGGTHPALLDGMAYGNCVVANEVPEHTEVIADTGVCYRKNDFEDLRQKLEELIANPARVAELGRLAAGRAAKLYCWDAICAEYESLFAEFSK